jgi:hypothetical protein
MEMKDLIEKCQETIATFNIADFKGRTPYGYVLVEYVWRVGLDKGDKEIEKQLHAIGAED